MNKRLQQMRVVIEAPRVRTVLTSRLVKAKRRPRQYPPDLSDVYAPPENNKVNSSYRLSFPYVVSVETAVNHNVFVSDKLPDATSPLWEFPLATHDMSPYHNSPWRELDLREFFNLSHVNEAGSVCYDNVTRLGATFNKRADQTVNWGDTFWNSPWTHADWTFIEEWAEITRNDPRLGAEFSLRRKQNVGYFDTIETVAHAKRTEGNWPIHTVSPTDMTTHTHNVFDDLIFPDEIKLGVNHVYSRVGYV